MGLLGSGEADRGFLILNSILSALIIFFGSWNHNKLSSNNVDNEWLNCLLQGSGSRVNEALEFLKEIDEFERNKAQ